MTLLSDTELAGLEEVAELGMQTEVSVLRNMPVERPDYDDINAWVTIAITTAMLYSPANSNPRASVAGGVIGDPETMTALLRKEIDAEPGDQLGVDGELFNIVGSNKFDTYSAALILSLRRFE